jgi:chromosome segregation ATPase
MTTEAAVKTKRECYQVQVKNLEEEVKNLREEANEFQEREIVLRSEIQTLKDTLAAQEQQLKQQTIREEELLLEYESVDAVRAHKCDDEWKVVMADDTA